MAGRRTFFFEGIGVSEGIAIAPAYVIETDRTIAESYEIAAEDIEEEVERFETAVRQAKCEVRAIGQEVAEKVDRQQAAIFDAHLLMLEDPYLIETTIKRMRKERRNAESVLWKVTTDLGNRMQAIGDQYFTERNHDLYDVSRRVIRHLRLSGSGEQAEAPSRHSCIVVANNLGPAETAQFSRDQVLGFCTNEGGPTGHAAIVAKAIGIPAVLGLEFVTNYVRTGDLLIVDGFEGKVILHPSAEQLRFYEKKADQAALYRQALEELRDVPAVTLDGTRINLFANIELPEEMPAVLHNGAEGIGLVRTEFLYLNRPGLPTHEEQTASYRRFIEGMDGRPVVMRTLDIGGDKLPAFAEKTTGANPFMGTRAIRLCLNNPDIFRTQLRAMLTAAAGSQINILIPMISGLDEMRESRRIVDEIAEAMREEGQPLPESIRIGAMVEIPSAALLAGPLCKEVDFLSIGTNDLVQYTLAVDRTNREVAPLYRESHPAVLELIRLTVIAGREHGIPVSVCGEMSSDPRFALLLIGMGVRTLSMAPSAIGIIKRVVRSVSIEEAEEMAREVLSKTSPSDVERVMKRRLKMVLDKLRQLHASTDGIAQIADESLASPS